MKRINIPPKFLYFTIIFLFAAIILFFSAIYPLGMDELRLSSASLAETFLQVKIEVTKDSPRFMSIFHVLLLRSPSLCKLVFTILNPFAQIFILLGLFFVINGRKINFKAKQDFYPFLLLILMYLLMIPNPSNTLFWIGGGMVYAWGFIPVLILLCFFRKTIDGKELKNSALSNFLMAFCGFAAGMSNENTGPMILGLTVLFFIYCKYKKIKIPKFYYFALTGIILGLTVMFISGAGRNRLEESVLFPGWTSIPFTNKLLLYIWHFNRFLAATFWLPVINLLGLLLILYDKKKLALKDKDFILSSLFCICGFALCLVLFVAPVPLRTYYSSALFFFISFIMLLLFIKKFYCFNFMKYISLILLITGFIFAPLITLPYIHLHKENHNREKIIIQARNEGKKWVFVNRLNVLKGPTENWTIYYYDILWPWSFMPLQVKYKIPLYYSSPVLSLATDPI